MTGDNIRVAPRHEGSLSAGTCRVFPFAQGQTTVMERNVSVVTNGCANNQPFCATDIFPETVSGRPDFIGSPVICADENRVAGFANDGMNCDMGIPLTCRMTFLNLEPFHGWIGDVTGGAMSVKVSMILLVLVGVVGKFLM